MATNRTKTDRTARTEDDVPKKATGLRRGRQTPRPFAFHWGSGNIVEEASFRGQYVEPCVQLLEYEDHPGSFGVRFCYYSLEGRFQRSPMMLDGEDSFEGLRAALKTTPRLRALLKKLLS
jgi:hypothetical protein